MSFLKTGDHAPTIHGNLNGVLETGGGDQGHAGTFALQQRVRADGGSEQQGQRTRLAPIRSSASTIACEGLAGVEKALSMRPRPRSTQAQSVKVPPVSMAR
jgi:hypothetical protein